MVRGRFGEAREAYETSLAIKQEIKGDLPGEGVVLGQLGTLALQEGDLKGAVRRHQEALALFRRLAEPAMTVVAQHQLGLAFQAARQWEPAERHYREAAELKKAQGMYGGPNVVQTTCNQLATVCGQTGRPEAAESWYRKDIEGGKRTGDTAGVAMTLSNLASLPQSQPGRLEEAHRLAEEALTIKQTLDPGATAIWKTHDILAQIADRQAQEAKRRFAGTAHELKRFAPVVAMMLAAVEGHEHGVAATSQFVELFTKAVGENAEFAKTLKRILSGERDTKALCARLSQSAPAIETILQALRPQRTRSPAVPGSGE